MLQKKKISNYQISYKEKKKEIVNQHTRGHDLNEKSEVFGKVADVVKFICSQLKIKLLTFHS